MASSASIRYILSLTDNDLMQMTKPSNVDPMTSFSHFTSVAPGGINKISLRCTPSYHLSSAIKKPQVDSQPLRHSSLKLIWPACPPDPAVSPHHIVLPYPFNQRHEDPVCGALQTSLSGSVETVVSFFSQSYRFSFVVRLGFPP